MYLYLPQHTIPIPQATTSHLLCCPTQSTTLVLTLVFDKALASGDTSTLQNFTLRGLIRLAMVFTSLTIYMTVISKFSFMAYICNHYFQVIVSLANIGLRVHILVPCIRHTTHIVPYVVHFYVACGGYQVNGILA